jgi:Tfp pilus assembly protein FimT
VTRGQTEGQGQEVVRNQRAVSIVELLIVVVILLIFSTLTIISYHNLTRGLVARSQANEINAAFVLARELAITNRTPHQVVIDLPARQLWIDRLNAQGVVMRPKVNGVETFLPETRITRVTVDSTVIPPTDQAKIVFRPDTTSNRALIQITRLGADLTDDSEFFTIILYPPTATARIYNERR